MQQISIIVNSFSGIRFYKDRELDDQVMRLYAVYKNPKDFPDNYVVRLFAVFNGATLATRYCMLADTLERARGMVPPGLVNFGRQEHDDPVIVETWM